MIEKEIFGKLTTGEEVTRYTLTNANGMKVSAIDYGACITNVIVPDRDNNFEDVVLGYDRAESYEENVPSFGAPIGRCANRISECAFTLNGKRYELDNNNEGNTLHGGYKRFNLNMYEAETGSNELGEYVRFSRVSTTEEQNFPGNLSYSITYILTEDNSLMIRYDAVSDEDTVLNMTNHSYFNINPKGEAGEPVLNLELKVNATKYTPIGADILPTGEIADVDGTFLDFRDFKVIGESLAAFNEKGYDHNYLLENAGELKEACVLRCPRNGITLTTSTDLPGLQVYSAPALFETGGKNGRDYGSSQGICFESQYFPNAINTPEFDSPILKAGEEYVSYTVYTFGIY
ncbi:MAG: galactose mutarotase [Lachnospiraceae bacterium]|nr:galactose mutarotase [Lachnospiraceae bacterium]